MPARKPIDVSVPPGTPVNVYVSRRPKTNVQALNESLRHAQQVEREEAKGVLREAGNRFVVEQASKKRMREAAARRGAAATKQAAWFPPPNKTHKPKKSLRGGGGAGVTFVDRDAAAYAAMGMDELAAPMHDAQAQASHYARQVEDLTRTVDDLRDKLDIERTSKELKSQAGALDEERARLQNEMEESRRLTDAVRATDRTRNDLMDQLHDFEAANMTLKNMLQDLNKQEIPAAFASAREQLLSKITETETANRRLREQLYKKDVEVEQLQNKVAHTGELQASFEALKRAQREAKTKMEKKLKAAKLDAVRKDDEINRLLAQQSSTAYSVAEVKDAVQSLEAAAASEKATMKRAHRETRHQLKHCEAALDKTRAECAHQAAEIRTLQALVEEKEASCGALRGQLQESTAAELRLSKTNTELQAQLNEMTRRCTKAEAELATKTAAVTHLEAVTQEYRATTAQQEADLGAKNAELARLRPLEIEHATLTRQCKENAELAAAAADNCVALNHKLEAAHRDLEVQSSNVAHFSHQAAAAEAEANAARQERHAIEQRERMRSAALEVDLAKTLEANAQLEALRKDGERQAESRLWDLKERLDYANTSKRSLQNYVGYVKNTYNNLFDKQQTQFAS